MTTSNEKWKNPFGGEYKGVQQKEKEGEDKSLHTSIYIKDGLNCQVFDKLIEYNHFIVYKLIWNEERQKYDKIPHKPNNPSIKARSVNSEDWVDVNTAIKSYQNNDDVDGIGFCISDKDPFVFIDLDNCKNSQCAIDYIKECNSWTEISQSGNGYHIIVIGDKPGNRCKKGDVEIYDKGRFVALTGNIFDNFNTIIENQEIIDKIYYNTFWEDKEANNNKPKKISFNTNIELDDLLRVSKNDTVFQELWNGSWNGNISHSEADYALIHKLSFYCDCDETLILEFFKQSGLYRSNKTHHLQDVINEALKHTNETFDWNKQEMVSDFSNDQIEPTVPEDNDKIYDFPMEVISGIGKDVVNIFTEKSELSPVHVYLSLITTLGSYFSNKLYIETMGRITPNLYTLILGDSNSKKSTAIREINNLIDDIDQLNVLYGVGSGEGLLEYVDTLGDSEDKKQVLLFYDEFKSFIDKALIQNSSLSNHICTLYENTKAENRTKKDNIRIENTYMSLIGACTYETYEDCWSSTFSSQGLTNRFFLVPGKSDKQVSLPQYGDGLDNVKKELNDINENVGIDYLMKLDDKAYKEYDKWYKKIKTNQNDIDVVKRIEWICLKLSMIIALLDKKYIIDKETIDKSIKICEWQMMVRSILKPIEADTLDSEIEGKIIKCLKSTKKPLSDRDIDIKTKIKSRKGTTHYDRVKSSLISSKNVIFVKHKDKMNDKRTKGKMWLEERLNELPEEYQIVS